MSNRALTPRVLLVLDASSAWSRGVLRGFTDAARKRKWRVLHYHPMADLKWLMGVWQPSALVLQASRYPDLASLHGCPIISVNDDGSREGIPSVCLDEEAIADLAADHLLSKGLTNLTVFRYNDGPFAVARERGFRRAVEARGEQLLEGWWIDGVDPPRSQEDPPALVSWLTRLSKPCGVFACTDSWARVVARYADVANLRIPEDVALIGVDNDTVDCELASPPLSSVAIAWRTVGEAAALLVEQALTGNAAKGQRRVIAPVDVIQRRSTDVSAIEDPVVARAVAWITEHSNRHVTLQAVARAASCSRQRLEQRFHMAIGRTVMQEVRRARVDAARRLLSTTDQSLQTVARECGFSDAAALSVAFRRQTGMPPGSYRRKFLGVDGSED